MGVIMLTAAEARAKLISREERLIDRAILEIERRIDAVAETRTSICIRDDDAELGQVVTDMLSSSGIGLSVSLELIRNGYSLSYGEYSATKTKHVEISWGK